LYASATHLDTRTYFIENAEIKLLRALTLAKRSFSMPARFERVKLLLEQAGIRSGKPMCRRMRRGHSIRQDISAHSTFTVIEFAYVMA
jgi:hypothetical protein